MLPANTFGHSLETLPEGLSGELVYVGSGHFADYEGKDVTGKITLSELSYSPGRHEKQRIAGLMGSTAQIMRNWGHPENTSTAVGLGEAGMGQSHAGDNQDRDADHSLHRHFPHRRRIPARPPQQGAGSRPAAHECREWLARSADDHRRAAGPLPARSSCSSAAIRTAGTARVRPTMPPAMPACWSWPASSRATRTSYGAASSSASGPRMRPEPWSARAGSPTGTGTACARMPSPT